MRTLPTSALVLLLAVPVQGQAESVEQDPADRAGLVPDGFPSLETMFGNGAAAADRIAGQLSTPAAGAFFNNKRLVEFVGLILGDPSHAAFMPHLPLGVTLQ